MREYHLYFKEIYYIILYYGLYDIGFRFFLLFTCRTEENEELPKKGKRKLKEYYEVLFDNKIINLPFSADSINVQQRGFHDYSKEMKLKKNHMNKPLWICSDGFIYLEMFNSCSKQASDFLITIAEPICRPEIIHEFQLTIFSLYAAISVGITLDELLLNLDKFSKNILPSELVYSIKKSAESFGKVKLVLRENKYYIEAKDKFELDYLLNNNIIKNARVYSKDVNNSNNNNSKKTTIFSLNNNFMENSRVDNTGASSRNILNEEVENKKQKDSYVTYEAPVLDTEQLGEFENRIVSWVNIPPYHIYVHVCFF